MNAIDLRLVVTDSPVGDYPEKIKCREHNDKSASLAVYRDNLHCYGCGFNMGVSRVLNALAYLLKIEPSEAVKIAQRYTVEELDAYRERASQEARRDPLPGSLAAIYHETLMTGRRRQRKDWLYARGLTDETLERFQIGHDGLRFTIPVYSAEGSLVAIRFRRDDAYDETGPKYLGVKGRNGLYLYPEHVIDPSLGYLVVCEGELDAIRLRQEGVQAVTLTNGAGQTPKLPAIIKEKYPHVVVLLIATDQDEPGQEAARLTERAALEAGFDALGLGRITWEGGKDVTEALQLGTLDIWEHLCTHLGG